MTTEQISTKKASINYGLILGGTLALITAIVYAVYLDLMTKWWLGIILFFVALSFGIASVGKSKKMQGGFISFKEAFTSYFITVAVGFIISTLVSILIFVVIDPDAATYLNEQLIEVTRSTMESFGTPETVMNEALAEMQNTNNFSIGNQLQGLAFQLIFYSVIGLLVALILKRKDPNEID